MSKNNDINDMRLIPLDSLEENEGQLFGLPANPRAIAPERFDLLKEDIRKYPEFLNINALKVYPMEDGQFIVIGGNMRFRALRELGYKEVPCVVIPKETPVESLKAYVVLDNSGFGQWDWAKLSSEEWDAAQLQGWGVDIPEEWNTTNGNAPGSDSSNGQDPWYDPLNKDFFVFPTSVLDTRRGDWVERKRKWINSGLKSGEGRDKELTFGATCLSPKELSLVSRYAHDKSITSTEAARILANEGRLRSYKPTSIFDPVLCEVCYRWYNVKHGTIIDPFAGGSVRGIVASALEMQYLGNDLREEQISANLENLANMAPGILSSDFTPMWTVGDSCRLDEIIKANAPDIYDGGADMIFSCPPYADLEKYSSLKEDLSNMEYEDFLTAYNLIIKKCYSLLKDNRFAVFVVGDIRGKNGCYRNFVSDTIDAFINAGFHYYGQLVVVNQVGSAAIRARSAFASRKIVKTHQQAIVAYKGDNPEPGKCDYEQFCVADGLRHFNEERIPIDNLEHVEVFIKGDAAGIKDSFPASANDISPEIKLTDYEI